jgi:phosphoglycerol transferase MdoB-like AlkP superfamily enzyme
MHKDLYYLKQLLYRLGIVFIILTILRFVFYLSNYSFFSIFSAKLILLSFFVGFRFDLSSLVYTNLVFIVLSLLPFSFRRFKGYQTFLFLVFIVFNSIMLALEVPDIEYYKFAQRRSGVGEFNLAGDFIRLIPSFVKSYWYLWLLFPVLVIVVNKVYKLKFWQVGILNTRWYVQSAIFLIGIGLSIIGARGGIQLRPITPVGAGVTLKDARLIPLATNTTLNFIFSFQQKALSEEQYFSDKELDNRFVLARNLGKVEKFKPLNVVLLIMESFGTEYVSEQRDHKLYTPFFDSLSRQGIFFERSYANAQRSAQGIVSITAGIPALMEEPFHFSPYQSNQVESIASSLKKMGYTSGFFHGSNPGSMDFERFASITGYDHFYDKSHYANDKDYDGSWGIWDIPFFSWTIDKLNSYRKPFFCTIFSLTSHSPYKVEQWFEKLHPNENDVFRSVRYSDEALRRFFKKAATTDWYKNTLFVVCADHTGRSFDEKYMTKEGLFRIPIVLYTPDTSVINRNMMAENPNKHIMSQIDIMPTVLDLLNYNQPFHCFGQSLFADNKKYTFQYNNGIYQIIDDEYLLLFDGKMVAGMYAYRKDKFLKKNIADELPDKRDLLVNDLKAVIQRYNRAMIRNELNR